MHTTHVLQIQLWQAMPSWSSPCAQVNCHGGKGLGPVVAVKGNSNATVHKNIL